jgi:hypothetical protein
VVTAMGAAERIMEMIDRRHGKPTTNSMSVPQR